MQARCGFITDPQLAGLQVDTPKEAARIKAHGGQVMPGGQRIISPSGRHSLNMARAFGDADYKTPNRIVSAVPDVRHVSLGCGLVATSH